MALKNLIFKPGIYEETTDRGVGMAGFWKDCDHIRFRDGFPEKIGGWRKFLPTQYLGVVRGAVDWQAISTFVKYGAFGTNKKLYVFTDDGIYDITPFRATGTLTDPFTTTNTSTTVSVAATNHGLSTGDYADFSGASAVGGITINGNYEVTKVDANTFTIVHSSAATSSAGPGGGSVSYGFEIPVGAASTTFGLGFGVGPYGAGTYGSARTVSTRLMQLRVWSLDTWGEDLIACHSDGNVYVWDSSAGTSTSAALIATAPTTNFAAFVSSEDRHVIVLGADSDPLLIRWCDQEDYNTWTPAITNTAGDKRLDIGTHIMAYAKIRGAHLIFTDTYVYSMQYSGPPYTYTFLPLGDNGGIRGPNSVAAFEGVAYWMGERSFYLYDGTVKELPCPVVSKILEDFNAVQRYKVWCGVNRKFREVWWLYTSSTESENDKYIVYNVGDQCWYYGTLERTALVGDSDTFGQPYGYSNDGYIYIHEEGTDDDGNPLVAYLESGDVEIDPEGISFQHLSKYIPDFRNLTGSVDVTFYGKRYPQDQEQAISGPHNITSTTKFVNPRMRARQMSVKIESSRTSDDWRNGHLRLDTLPHGKR